MAVNSFLEREGTDIRSLCWEGFEYFYMSVYNVYPNLKMDESSYKSYQLNYVTRLKSWRRRKTPPGAAYHDAQSLVWEAACASSDWRVYLKPKTEVKASKIPPSENSVSSKVISEPGDKLAGRYQCAELDSVWTADVTQLGSQSLLLIMDLGPRQVVGHKLFPDYPSATDVAKLLAESFSSRQRPKMFHSDSGRIFTSKVVTALLDSECVVISRGNQKYRKHHNQVQERLHRTIKDLLARKLYVIMSKAISHTKDNAWVLLAQMPREEATTLVHEVIEFYNSKFHRGIGASPNLLDTAMAVYGEGVNLLAKKGSLAGDKVEEWKRTVVSKYAGDWQRFFIEFYIRNLEEHKATQARIRDSAHEVITASEQHFQKVIAALEREKLGLKSELDSSRKELSVVQARLTEMEKNLKYIYSREATREQEDLEKQARKARRRARKRQPLRDALFVKEYRLAQSFLSGDGFEVCRDRVGLLLMFLTGLRVRSLLLTTGGHLSKLLSFLDEDNQTLVYPGIKSASAATIRIHLPSEARPLISDRSKDINRLLAGRAPHEKVMSRSEGSQELLSISNLTRRLNRIMHKLSERTGKLFRTHSFRIGLTTSLVAKAGIEIARDIMGHKDYGTTASYNRHTYTQTELSKALGAAYRSGAPRRRRNKSTCKGAQHADTRCLRQQVASPQGVPRSETGASFPLSLKS